uniref:Uncharacterized protein n=1 Tax=Nelumbo nucifera TaxID=4432 RepID=A0A822XWS5_NELNU|nr:TPA_asm: hypothetical protein HUJ06_026241 [Nelumbo nucifera]
MARPSPSLWGVDLSEVQPPNPNQSE